MSVIARLDPAIHRAAARWMPIAVSSKPLAAAGTSFLREPGSSPGMTRMRNPSDRSPLPIDLHTPGSLACPGRADADNGTRARAGSAHATSGLARRHRRVRPFFHRRFRRAGRGGEGGRHAQHRPAQGGRELRSVFQHRARGHRLRPPGLGHAARPRPENGRVQAPARQILSLGRSRNARFRAAPGHPLP
jgi:hypothetical protein